MRARYGSLKPPARAREALTSATSPRRIRTLSLHDALPISRQRLQRLEAAADGRPLGRGQPLEELRPVGGLRVPGDRKSTRLNSSHVRISYAVFCLKIKMPTTEVRISPRPRHSRVPPNPCPN